MPKHRRKPRQTTRPNNKQIDKQEIPFDMDDKTAKALIHIFFKQLIGLSLYHDFKLNDSSRLKGLTTQASRQESNDKEYCDVLNTESQWATRLIKAWFRYSNDTKELSTQAMFHRLFKLSQQLISAGIACETYLPETKTHLKTYQIYITLMSIELQTCQHDLPKKNRITLLKALSTQIEEGIKHQFFIREDILNNNLLQFSQLPVNKNIFKSKHVQLINKMNQLVSFIEAPENKQFDIFNDKAVMDVNNDEDTIKSLFQVYREDPADLITRLDISKIDSLVRSEVDQIIALKLYLSALNQVFCSSKAKSKLRTFFKEFQQCITLLGERCLREENLEALLLIQCDPCKELNTNEDKSRHLKNYWLADFFGITITSHSLLAENLDQDQNNKTTLNSLCKIIEAFPKNDTKDSARAICFLNYLETERRQTIERKAKFENHQKRIEQSNPVYCDNDPQFATEMALKLISQEQTTKASKKKKNKKNRIAKTKKMARPFNPNPENIGPMYRRPRRQSMSSRENNQEPECFSLISSAFIEKDYDTAMYLSQTAYNTLCETKPFYAAKALCYLADSHAAIAAQQMIQVRTYRFDYEKQSQIFSNVLERFETSVNYLTKSLILTDQLDTDRAKNLHSMIQRYMDLIDYNLNTVNHEFILATQRYEAFIQVKKREYDILRLQHQQYVQAKPDIKYERAFKLIKHPIKKADLEYYEHMFAKVRGFHEDIRSYCRHFKIKLTVKDLITNLNDNFVDKDAYISPQVKAVVVHLGAFFWKYNARYKDGNIPKSPLIVAQNSLFAITQKASESSINGRVDFYSQHEKLKMTLSDLNQDLHRSEIKLRFQTPWQRRHDHSGKRNSLPYGPGIWRVAACFSYEAVQNSTASSMS